MALFISAICSAARMSASSMVYRARYGKHCESQEYECGWPLCESPTLDRTSADWRPPTPYPYKVSRRPSSSSTSSGETAFTALTAGMPAEFYCYCDDKGCKECHFKADASIQPDESVWGDTEECLEGCVVREFGVDLKEGKVGRRGSLKGLKKRLSLKRRI